MAKNNSSRILVNLLGIPSLLAIIYLGDSYSNIPVFSVFIGIVLYLGALEIAPLSKMKNTLWLTINKSLEAIPIL